MSDPTPESVAARLTEKEYLTLRNTVRILRQVGRLCSEQEKRVQQYEAAVKAYEEAHKL